MTSDKKVGILIASIVGILVVPSPIRFVLGVLSNGEFYYFSISLFWSILFDSSSGAGIHYNEPAVLFGYFLFCGLRFAFPVQLLRYYRSETSASMIFLTALIGEVPPLLLILTLPLFSFIYVGPIPYHIIAALIFLAIKRPKDSSTPWDSYEASLEEIYS